MITLINPSLLVQCSDPFTTGVLYMPIGLATIAAVLKRENHEVQVIDAFGLAPKQVIRTGIFYHFGLQAKEVVDRVDPKTQAFGIYAPTVISHTATIKILQEIRRRFPQHPIAILENNQAVTAYSLKEVAHHFMEAGATDILTGNVDKLLLAWMNKISGKSDWQTAEITLQDHLWNHQHPMDMNTLPFPEWDLFPLENYWKLHFGHGPVTSSRYLPLLTSRGCPYQCRFCVVPSTNHGWQSKSARRLADEIIHLQKKYGVSEFHIEDLNPTVSEKRIIEFCHILLDEKIEISWKLVSGTKVETIRHVDTIDLMASAGCTYISISPETGSQRLLKEINKPFDLVHAKKIIQRCQEKGVFLQTCFVLGFPGETDEDRELTKNLVDELTCLGASEIALFIITPVPGSKLYLDGFGKDVDLSKLSFSPTWRADYDKIARFRKMLYRRFLLKKILHYPVKVFIQCWNFLSRRFDTKMEMIPYRGLYYFLHGLRARD